MLSCKTWLELLLRQSISGVLCDTIREQAKEAGYSKAELKAARKELNVKTYHQFDEEGSTPNWFWYLSREN